ncbi:putative bifunctional diguanylate cyclase/phosphodiesterase [Roseateles sp. GG27B]
MTPLTAILMVDDNPTNLYLLKAVLDHAGVELVRAGSGAQALRLELQLAHLTQHDQLTGLPNRAGLEQSLAEALAHSRGHSVTVLSITLDSGRNVIDSLSHTASDALLQVAARHLRGVVRSFGHQSGHAQNLVAHLGGDEFLLVLQGLANAADAANLLKAANIALTQSRREVGSGYRLCTAELAARSERRFEIERGLGHALAQDELVLHYQPRMSLASGKLCGFEALLRWQSPQLGQVGPTEFIPLAENTGLIVSIGEWVLLHACQQATDWLAAGLDCPTMAVNVSPHQLKSDSFIAPVRAALERSGLAPQHLELEITESAAVFEDADSLALLHRLKELGVNVAIDAFGTGYSNLSLLKHFQFDRIMTDQPFMPNIAEDDVNRAIATALLVLARELRIPVLAEGVETQEQLVFLREHCGGLRANVGGCEVQGYLFGHPLPTEDCTELLALRRHLN